ncbi:MAG TPA: carboxypeptidase-like regulatory domain-containing protein, partial [Chitinophagaceae bacterium]|nr:carboxypeptidase-like regulatory domain-containing protein [Chitinophagaceae bacterium]
MLPKYFALIVLLVTSYGISAQNRLSDSATSFIVNGTCGECKQRIQKALKVKGITSASWSPKTKILDLKYSPSKISIQQVHEIISGIGHDTEKAKAADNVYNALPDCCLYRDPNNLHHDDEEALEKDDDLVRGAVFQNNDGSKLPLAGASIFWAGTNEGTISDSAGEFSLFRHDSSDRLAISYAGFKADTIAIADMHDVEIVLSTNGELSQVIVTSRSRTSYVDSYSPFRTAVMTKKELLKAACCNLSESFETNPSVDVAYSDAATGSKQIQLLGLSGNYTQLTVEGLPGPRGLATPLGL